MDAVRGHHPSPQSCHRLRSDGGRTERSAFGEVRLRPPMSGIGTRSCRRLRLYKRLVFGTASRQTQWTNSSAKWMLSAQRSRNLPMITVPIIIMSGAPAYGGLPACEGTHRSVSCGHRAGQVAPPAGIRRSNRYSGKAVAEQDNRGTGRERGLAQRSRSGARRRTDHGGNRSASSRRAPRDRMRSTQHHHGYR